MITEDDVGSTFQGTIVCSSQDGWLPVVDAIEVSVTVDPATREVTGSARAEIGTSTNVECYATSAFPDSDGIVYKSFNLAGQTNYIEDEYKRCILPLGDLPGGTLKADFTVLSVTGSGSGKVIRLSISVLPCDRGNE